MVACQPSPVVPPGFEPLVTPLPALAVPPGFLLRAASTTLATPHVAQASPAAPRAAPESPAAPRAVVAPPEATDGPPPCEWPSSPIVYTKRPR
jgi:hypothetical protein